MLTQLRTLRRDLWLDDIGGLVTTEYLALGTVLVLGGIGGLSAMSKAMNDEMAEYGESVSAINQSYREATLKNNLASKQGAVVNDQDVDSRGMNCCP